jgi:hypothetical protein
MTWRTMGGTGWMGPVSAHELTGQVDRYCGSHIRAIGGPTAVSDCCLQPGVPAGGDGV